VPDPTSLTTEALQREVFALREVIDAQVSALAKTVDLHVDELKAVIAELRRYYDAILAERNLRTEERYKASQTAVSAAFEASQKAVSAAFEASDRAITKAEISIEKRADATYVALGELQRLLGGLMPRQEAEARYTNQEERLTALGSRLDKLEAIRQGGQERTTEVRQNMAGVYAAAGVALALLAIVVPVVLVLTRG
jgi:hypothetical protein